MCPLFVHIYFFKKVNDLLFICLAAQCQYLYAIGFNSQNTFCVGKILDGWCELQDYERFFNNFLVEAI